MDRMKQTEIYIRTQVLPQLTGGTFLTEAGLETDLIFNHGVDLPYFASFPLLEDDNGRATLRAYYQSFVDVARRDDAGVVFETPTWRANPDWATRLGYSVEDLDRVNRAAVALLAELSVANPDVVMVVSGNLGPRGDGYSIDSKMTVDEAVAYHSPQIRSLASAGADLVSVLTMTYVDEAVGIVMAAVEVGIPVVVSFTLETDGKLPSGQRLAEAIREVDERTGASAAYFMVNCAHPTHFADVFSEDGPWDRLGGIRANASQLSHEELDNATELDRGDIADLADRYAALRRLVPSLAVFGGCCGTDVAHVDAISSALQS